MPSTQAAPVIAPNDERDYMRREADDIDARDARNQLLCAEYVNEMYDIFRQSEKEFQVNANYMTTQPYVNERMRTILIDWLVEVHFFQFYSSNISFCSLIESFLTDPRNFDHCN